MYNNPYVVYIYSIVLLKKNYRKWKIYHVYASTFHLLVQFLNVNLNLDILFNKPIY